MKKLRNILRERPWTHRKPRVLNSQVMWAHHRVKTHLMGKCLKVIINRRGNIDSRKDYQVEHKTVLKIYLHMMSYQYSKRGILILNSAVVKEICTDAMPHLTLSRKLRKIYSTISIISQERYWTQWINYILKWLAKAIEQMETKQPKYIKWRKQIRMWMYGVQSVASAAFSAGTSLIRIGMINRQTFNGSVPSTITMMSSIIRRQAFSD